jgi:tetratricopeptide (TPR) repeat protein
MYATRGLDDYVKGGWALESGDLAGATTSICSAAQQAPDVSIYQFQCGVLLAREYFQYKNADALSSAIRSFQTGLAIDPYWPVHKANLAILLRQQGKYEETYAYLKEVTQQSPNNSLFTINLGFMAEIIGERASAKENYAHLLEIDPWIRLTDFFTWRPEMLPSDEGTPRDEIVFRLIDARIDIESRKFRSAAETLETILIEEPNDPEALALFALIAQELGDPDAWFLAQKSIFIDGDNPRTLIWVSQVARAVGEDETAARWIHQAFSIWASKREYDSEIFYSIYDPSPVVSSFIPGYVRADLSAEVEEAFLWLANHFQQTGREEKADALLLAIGMEMDVGPTR